MVVGVSEIIGMLAGFLCAFSSVPQAVKIIKHQTAISVSGFTFSMIFFGELLWLTYGIMENSISLIFWPSVAVVFTGLVLYLKLKDQQKEGMTS